MSFMNRFTWIHRFGNDPLRVDDDDDDDGGGGGDDDDGGGDDDDDGGDDDDDDDDGGGGDDDDLVAHIPQHHVYPAPPCPFNPQKILIVLMGSLTDFPEPISI